MEQAHAGEGHDHALLVTLFDDQIITYGTAGLGDVLHTGGKGPLDVVAEGEEGVAAQSNIAAGCQPGLLIAFRQPLRLLSEVILPDAVGADILFIAVDVMVKGRLLPSSISRWAGFWFGLQPYFSSNSFIVYAPFVSWTACCNNL